MAANSDNIMPPSDGAAGNSDANATTYPEEKRAASVTSGRNIPMIEMGGKDGITATDKEAEFLPSPEEQIEALGIAYWRHLEKKIVRRLDLTLMPCLWVS